MIKQRCSLILSMIGLCTAVLVLLGLLVPEWGFLHDDYGMLWHVSHINSWQSLCKLFFEPGMHVIGQPSNYVMPEQSFFVIIYRPFSCIIHALQLWVLGLEPYKHFFVTIALHALNTGMLFFLYTRFLPPVASFWAASFFAFHLSFWDWLGWISGQQHVILLALMLVLLVCVMYYVQTEKWWICGIIGILQITALFLREEPIIMPFWLLLTYIFYRKIFPHAERLWSVLGMLVASNIFYLFIRISFYPIEKENQGLCLILNPIFNFITSLRYRFFDGVTFAVDVTHLSWMPGGNRLLKGIVICVMAALLSFMLYRSAKRRDFIFCVLSMGMWLWPVIVRHYSSRYLYMALPFFCALLAFVFVDEQTHPIVLSIKRTFLWLLLIFSLIMLPMHFRSRGNILHSYNQALIDLARNPLIQHSPICFIGIPYEIFPTGCAQALWMYGLPITTPVYYDRRNFVWTKSHITTNLLEIKKIDNGFRLISKDDVCLWFLPMDPWTQMGSFTVHDNDNKRTGKISDMSFTFDTHWLDQGLKFITWDFEKQTFKFIE